MTDIDKRLDEYRTQVRRTFQKFSDEALAFQDARIIGGIDREECDREKARRAQRCCCPDDCNCHHPHRFNYCGCKAH
jgi:hypothetical protein